MYDCNYRNISLNPKPEFSTAQSFYPSQGPLNCRDSSLCLTTVPSGSGLNVIFSGKHQLPTILHSFACRKSSSFSDPFSQNTVDRNQCHKHFLLARAHLFFQVYIVLVYFNYLTPLGLFYKVFSYMWSGTV